VSDVAHRRALEAVLVVRRAFVDDIWIRIVVANLQGPRWPFGQVNERIHSHFRGFDDLVHSLPTQGEKQNDASARDLRCESPISNPDLAVSNDPDMTAFLKLKTS
jgi:hypothetical protein